MLVDEIAEQEAAGDEQSAPAQSTVRIVSALEALGYEPVELALQPGKTDEWLGRLMGGSFRLAFNLCETVNGRAAGEHLTAAAVELLEMPMTGASSATLLYCLNKDRCSATLRANGIRVPDWRLVRRGDPPPHDWTVFPAIVKPAAEDGSNGVHANSVVRSQAELLETVERLRARWGLVLIQQFIEGREINLAIVGRYLLPPAEIDFSTLPDGAPAIVSFEAKWVAGSPEDLGTRPICPALLPPKQARDLQRLAAHSWKVMEGRGYARVDVRLTPDGVPYVIDINPNPDLSIDAGLARQARVAGWAYDDLIGSIVEEALARGERGGQQAEGWTLLPGEAAGGGSLMPSVSQEDHALQAAPGPAFQWRPPRGADRARLAEIVAATGVFRPDELEVALEVFDDYCKAPGQNYHALAVYAGPDELAGFALFGPTPCTVNTWDLYWIAMHPRYQRAGAGRGLLERVERHMRSAGARICVIETSSRQDYDATRRFYLACGYREVARVADIYDAGDDRVTYAKQFEKSLSLGEEPEQRD